MIYNRISKETSNKLHILLVIALSSLFVYISIKFLLPVAFPFILSLLLSKITIPISSFLHKRLNFHITSASIISVTFLGIIIAIASYYLISSIISQNHDLIINHSYYRNELNRALKNCCHFACNYVGESADNLYFYITDKINEFSTFVESNVFPVIMSYTVSTVKSIFNIFLYILTSLMALYFYTRDHGKIRTFLTKSPFNREFVFIKEIVSDVCGAYLKTQITIMIIVSALCSIAFGIVHNPYFILLGILIGLADILPLIGAGTFLVPITVYYFIYGRTKEGLIFLTVFILCYLIREILEPKLMGKQTGISSLSSLISIFVGYKIFGILGMILGPFAYIFIKKSIEYFKL